MKKIIIYILIAVALLSGFYIFSREAEPKLEIINGEEIISVDPYYLFSHPRIETFPSVVRSSGQKPVETSYTGIELSKLFEDLGIQPDEKITLNAEDGYRIVISRKELEEPHNVYLAFSRDGEVLESRKKGGNGPYQLIIRRDPFSQRWIKHVEVIIAAPSKGADN